MQPIRGAQPSGAPPATSWRARCQPRPSGSSGRMLSLDRRSFSWRRPGAGLATLCVLEALRCCAKSQAIFGPLRPGSPRHPLTSRPWSCHPPPSLYGLSFRIYKRSVHYVLPQRCSPRRQSAQGRKGSPCDLWGPKGVEFPGLAGCPFTRAVPHMGDAMGIPDLPPIPRPVERATSGTRKAASFRKPFQITRQDPPCHQASATSEAALPILWLNDPSWLNDLGNAPGPF